jgi:hypothetical protein
MVGTDGGPPPGNVIGTGISAPLLSVEVDVETLGGTEVSCEDEIDASLLWSGGGDGGTVLLPGGIREVNGVAPGFLPGGATVVGTSPPLISVDVDVETKGGSEEADGFASLETPEDVGAGNVTGTGTRTPSEPGEIEVDTLGTSGLVDTGTPVDCDATRFEKLGGGPVLWSPGACGPGGVTGGPRRSVLHLSAIKLRITFGHIDTTYQ